MKIETDSKVLFDIRALLREILALLQANARYKFREDLKRLLSSEGKNK